MIKEIIIQGIFALGISVIAITATFCASILSVGGIETLRHVISGIVSSQSK